MSWLVMTVVIFVTSLALFWVGNRAQRPKRVPLTRLADPRPLPGELPRAGRLRTCCDTPPGGSHQGTCPNSVMMTGKFLPDVNEPPPFRGASLTGEYGPFPVDTGPLLILSEQAAANVALEREIRQRCAEAEAKIPPRWRS